MNKPDGITINDWKLLQQKYEDLDPIVARIKNNYPVQYLIGDVSFYGYKIEVNENVLIPRFETEYLVEKTINIIKEYHLNKINALEVGTGSGCISIALKREISSINIKAIDISEKALSVAKNNANNNKTKIDFERQDIFCYQPKSKFDLLISNPPYIAFDENIDPKTRFEPQIALYADDKGMKYYKYIIDNYQKLMNEHFIMAFEIGEQQGDFLYDYASKHIPHSEVRVEKDLSGRDRYLFIINE